MNIEFNKQSIIELINVLIDKNYDKDVITLSNFEKITRKYRYTGPITVYESSTHHYIEVGDQTHYLRELKFTPLVELALSIDELNIRVYPDFDQQLDELYETNIVPVRVKKLFGSTTYNFTEFQYHLNPKYTISIGEQHETAKKYEITELEFLSIINHYHDIVRKNEIQRAQNKQIIADRQNIQLITALMDRYKIEKKIL